MRVCIYEFAKEKDALELWVSRQRVPRARNSIKTLAPVMGLRPEAFVAHNKDAPYITLYLKKWNVTLEVTMKRIDRRRG